MRIHRLYTNKLAFLAVAILSLAACSKPCQPIGGTITSLVNEKGFRLISTTNPNITVNNYTTLVMQFTNSFGGTLKKLQDNVLFNVYTIRYNINYQTKTLAIEYTPVAGGNTDGTNMSGGSGVTVVHYRYAMTTHLILTDLDHGNQTYDFVPYQGVIDPTNSLTQDCTFR
jgi:hypothetical protein